MLSLTYRVFRQNIIQPANMVRYMFVVTQDINNNYVSQKGILPIPAYAWRSLPITLQITSLAGD